MPALAHWTVVAAFRPLHALMAAPAILFLATLTIMLFRPPDLQFYWLDRIAFLFLLFVVLLRALALRRSATLRCPGPVADGSIAVAGPWQSSGPAV